MNLTLEQLKDLAKKKEQGLSTVEDSEIIMGYYDYVKATIKNKKKLPLEKKIELAEKSYYWNLFAQPSEEEALDRIMWEFWGSPGACTRDLMDIDESMKRAGYGSFFDRYNQPTFEEFKNGVPLNDEGNVYDELTAIL